MSQNQLYTKERIFANDSVAYTLYPKPANRLYNRLDLAHSQGIIAAPFGVLPPPDLVSWPLIMKPIVNLYGMSRNYQVIPSEDAYLDALQDNTISGQFWMPFVSGRHYTVDALMYRGVIIFYYALESVHNPANPGRFRYHVYRPEYILPANIQAELAKYCLAEYSGPLNIEIIDPKQGSAPAVIIEAHLRWNGDNYIWKIKKNKPVLEHILITANGKASELARLATQEPHRVPALCAYMRKMIPGEYYYVPVFIDKGNGTSELKDVKLGTSELKDVKLGTSELKDVKLGTSELKDVKLGTSELKDQVWEFASNQGWPVVWDSLTGIHQPGAGPARLCMCILKTETDVTRLETFKSQLGVL